MSSCSLLNSVRSEVICCVSSCALWNSVRSDEIRCVPSCALCKSVTGEVTSCVPLCALCSNVRCEAIRHMPSHSKILVWTSVNFLRTVSWNLSDFFFSSNDIWENVPINFTICHSGCQRVTSRNPMTSFPWNVVRMTFIEIWVWCQFLIKSDNHSKFFTWRPLFFCERLD